MEIGRSIGELDNKVRELNKSIKASTDETREFDRALRIDGKNTEAMAGKMRGLQNQIGLASQKLAMLKQRQEDARRSFESGAMTEAEFNKITLSVLRAENQVAGFNKALSDTSRAQSQAQLQSIERGFDRITASLDRAQKAAQGLSRVSMGVIGALTGVVYAYARVGNELNNMATRYRVSVEEIQLQRHAFSRVTGDARNYDAALSRMAGIMTQIARGNGKAYENALVDLGVAVRNTDGSTRNLNDVFNDMMGALSKIEDDTKRANMAMAVMGKTGIDVATMAGISAEELLALNEQMIANGLISTEAAEQAAELSNQMDDLRLQFLAAGAELATALMPVIQMLVEFLSTTVIPILTRIAEWFAGMQPWQQRFLFFLLVVMVFLPKIIGIVKTLITVTKAITVALFGTAKGVGAVSLAAKPLLPIMWAVAAVVLVLVLLFAMLAGRSRDVTRELNQQQAQMQDMQNDFAEMETNFDMSSNQISTNTNTNRAEVYVRIEAEGDNQISQENAELVADILADRINKQLGGKI